MTFSIATNAPDDLGIKSLIPDYILDSVGEAASDKDAAIAFAYHMIWKIQKPKKMDTVRKHYLANWVFLARLSEILPEHFDEVQAAYAERALKFDQQELVA